MNNNIGTKESVQTQELSKTTVALSTGLLGVLLVFLVGLSAPMQIHNAAHDVRHTAAFPCH